MKEDKDERGKERKKEREEKKKNDGEWRRGKAGPFNGQLKLERAPRYFFFCSPVLDPFGREEDRWEVGSWKLEAWEGG